MFKLRYELKDYLRLEILGDKEILAKHQNCIGTQPNIHSPLQK